MVVFWVWVAATVLLVVGTLVMRRVDMTMTVFRIATIIFCLLLAAGCSTLAVGYWLDGVATSGRDARQFFVLVVFLVVFALSAVGGVVLIGRAMRRESTRPAADPAGPARGARADEQR